MEQITSTNKINSVARPNCILKLVNTLKRTFQIHISTIISKTDQPKGLLENFAEVGAWKKWSVYGRRKFNTKKWVHTLYPSHSAIRLADL